MTSNLRRGAYDRAVTRSLARSVAALEEPTRAEVEALDDADAADPLVRHFAGELRRMLAALPEEDRAARALDAVNRLLALFPSILAEDADHAVEDAELEPPPRRLVSVYTGAPPKRPVSPLGATTLFTRGRGEPALGSELSREIASADRVDALVAFVTTGGVRALTGALEEFSLRAPREGAPSLRVLTTTFTGTTEVAAIEALAKLPGARVKISYDVRRTRLHAKAWLFHRETGLSTAYVGSANLTATALGTGHEWMIKVAGAELPDVVSKFAGTFETLWNDAEFEDYDPESDGHRARLAEALGAARHSGHANAMAFVSIRPYPFQQTILDKLRTEREVLGQHRNLVVAATGTGKTVIAALDYARLAEAAGARPRLLFVAHRAEILEQALGTFRHVLHDASFGELHGGGRHVGAGDHVFSTVQSAGALIAQHPPDHWQHVVLDECHHAPAASYRALVEQLRPVELVGLTATPERTDGRSLLPDFGGRVAAELRLWSAMEQQLLVPFEYYGLADGTDLSSVEWTRTGYASGALSNVYTGDDRRAHLVLAQLARRVPDVRTVRGLGFCVSVEHAEFMARVFTAKGVPSIALHGGSEDSLRETASRRLRERDVNFVFTCDLYNEGVDLPFVDTLLLLRPTMSATLFMQQLGRGLRLHEKKSSCLVLDFIGQHRKEFRFDAVLTALTNVPRARLVRAVTDGFPFLPTGCTLSLDRVATESVLGSLRRALRGAERLAEEARSLAAETGAQDLSLGAFLTQTSRNVEDVYAGDFGWATVRRLAGFAPKNDAAEELSREFSRLLHVDDVRRLGAFGRLGSTPPGADAEQYVMLDAQLHHRGVVRTAEETAQYISEAGGVAELRELSSVLTQNLSSADEVRPVAEWPLLLHRHYEPHEILTAVGRLAPGRPRFPLVGGVLHIRDTRRELLFVTLDKSGTKFSPTTRYRDYAVSPDRFHWETQGTVSVSRSGRRYVESPTNGWQFYLFVRVDRDSPYAFLGEATYESHSGDRPIGIVWRTSPLPGALFERFASLAQG